MLDFLFRRLTADPRRGAELFGAVTDVARQPHWYTSGGVPDTLEGRFAMLATAAALVLVRLEREGAAGDLVSVALTERFVEVMESEHRELGLGDPSLGKQVRKLVGSLARRAELWRAAVNGEREWRAAVEESLYGPDPAAEAVDHSASALKRFWSGLEEASLERIGQGEIA
jgi:cytochrome b pre-mRNA-processing protein 3